MIMKKHSEIFGWGNNSYGQLGISESSNPFERVPRAYTFQVQLSVIACGEIHSLCLSSTGHLYSFGSNKDGRLGINDDSVSHSSCPCLIKSLPRISKVACGASHSMALSTSGELYTWGLGRFGNLGAGSTTNYSAPVIIDFSSQLSCLQISAGSKHSSIIMTDGHKSILFTCGEGIHGQLGTGKYSNENCFVRIKENVLLVACGYEHTALITNDYELFVCGSNSEGQLGLGSLSCTPAFTKVQSEEIVKVACSNLTVCITSTGKLLLAGNHNSTLNSVDNSQVISEVAAGTGYFLAVDCNKKVFLWESGKLKTYQKFVGKNIEKVAAGKDFFLALGQNLETEKRVRRLSMDFDNKGMTCRNSGTARVKENWNSRIHDWDGIFEEEKKETKNYVESLQKELENCKMEMRVLKQNRESESYKLDNELNRLNQENKELQKGIFILDKENQELAGRNYELEAQLKSVYSDKIDALNNLDMSQAENEELKAKVANLVRANKDLSKQIEDDISTQVRSYKEKTMDLLNSSISPRIENKFIGQITPTKENLKAKMAALQSNRVRLEANLKSIL